MSGSLGKNKVEAGGEFDVFEHLNSLPTLCEHSKVGDLAKEIRMGAKAVLELGDGTERETSIPGIDLNDEILHEEDLVEKGRKITERIEKEPFIILDQMFTRVVRSFFVEISEYTDEESGKVPAYCLKPLLQVRASLKRIIAGAGFLVMKYYMQLEEGGFKEVLSKIEGEIGFADQLKSRSRYERFSYLGGRNFNIFAESIWEFLHGGNFKDGSSEQLFLKLAREASKLEEGLRVIYFNAKEAKYGPLFEKVLNGFSTSNMMIWRMISLADELFNEASEDIRAKGTAIEFLRGQEFKAFLMKFAKLDIHAFGHLEKALIMDNPGGHSDGLDRFDKQYFILKVNEGGKLTITISKKVLEKVDANGDLVIDEDKIFAYGARTGCLGMRLISGMVDSYVKCAEKYYFDNPDEDGCEKKVEGFKT